jgi:hypothetical protein
MGARSFLLGSKQDNGIYDLYGLTEKQINLVEDIVFP